MHFRNSIRSHPATSLVIAATAQAYTIDCREYGDPTLREGALLAAAAPGAVAMSGDLACLFDGGQLLVVDASNADAPQVLGVWTPLPGDTIEAVAMGPDYAVVRIGVATLMHIDLRNPAAPVPVPPAYTAGDDVGLIAAAGDRVCAQVGGNGLQVLAQADGLPLSSLVVTLPGAIGGLAMGPQHAYVTQGLFTLTTVAITTAPAVVHSAECYESYGLALAGGRLVVDRHGDAVDGDNQFYSWRTSGHLPVDQPGGAGPGHQFLLRPQASARPGRHAARSPALAGRRPAGAGPRVHAFRRRRAGPARSRRWRRATRRRSRRPTAASASTTPRPWSTPARSGCSSRRAPIPGNMRPAATGCWPGWGYGRLQRLDPLERDAAGDGPDHWRRARRDHHHLHPGNRPCPCRWRSPTTCRHRRGIPGRDGRHDAGYPLGGRRAGVSRAPRRGDRRATT